ncbi:MAG: TetR/AcrR family transcriptional regulator [Trueperaceae bacterium]|nr:TetR/AcrR family transcriptional regulator [Trueperaceae bacterium]
MTLARHDGPQGGRAGRVARNDARIERAAIEVLAAEGWAGTSFNAVARRAGLSKRPLRDRYAHRGELVARVWTVHLGPALLDHLEAVLDAAPTVGPDARPAHPCEAGRALADALTALAPRRRPNDPAATETLDAALEALLVAPFDDDVRRAVDADLGASMRAWTRPQLPVGTCPQAAAAAATGRAYLLATALGLALFARTHPDPPVDLRSEAAGLARALAAAVPPTDWTSTAVADVVPPDAAWLRWPPLDTGDDDLDELLYATLDLVSEAGFDGASTDAICRRAHVSEGFLFGRYDTKLDLFVDATRRLQSKVLADVEVRLRRYREQYGDATGRAITLRDATRPGGTRARALALELHRVAWHEPALREVLHAEREAMFVSSRDAFGDVGDVAARASFHAGTALGTGVVLLASFVPSVHALPWNVVTDPHVGQGPGQA